MVAVLVLLFLSGACLVVRLALHVLLRSRIDIDSHLVYALAFLLLSTLLHHFLLAFLAFLLLSLLLRTCALVERVEIYSSKHIHLGSVQYFLFTLCREYGSRTLCVVLHCLIFRFLFLLWLNILNFRSYIYGSVFRLCFFNHVVGIIVFVFFSGCISGSRFVLCCRSINGFDYFSFCSFNGFHLTDGSSLCLLCLFSIRHRVILRSTMFVDAVEIYFAQWLILLLFSSRQKFLRAVFFRFLRTFFLLRLLQQKLLGLRSDLFVLLELTHESLILLIVELKARFRLHLAQFTSFFKELHCRLESDIQLT